MSAAAQALDSPPLGKSLASTVKGLSAFLSAADHDALPMSEMAKLWKGIFYCYWMSDKPLVQQALSSELAELLLTISSTDASLKFLRGFWDAIVREWNGIDRLRMDKYYMLVRKFVNASFRLLVRADWDKSVVDKYNSILTCRGGPLCPEDNRVPTSLSYHLADVYLTELNRSLESSPHAGQAGAGPLPVPLFPLLSPFLYLASLTNSNVTYQRVYSEIIEPLFSALKPCPPPEAPLNKRPRLLNKSSFDNIVANSCLENPEEEGKVESTKTRKALLRKMFDIASGPDARETNRRKMYAIWKAAMAEEDENVGDDEK